MSDLLQKQQKFSIMLAQLVIDLNEKGYRVVFGEVKRTQVQADQNAKTGKGISNSLHLISLAGDLLLFKDGVYLTKTKDYLVAGIMWEAMGGSWGGRFISNPDGNHFSLSHNGVR